MKSPTRFCLLALLLVGCSSSNESANKLFIEATRLLQESFAQESSDPEAAVVASEKALNKIEKITRSYPSSDWAVKLVQGQTIFNELSVKALQDRQKELQATAKVVHDATESPQGLAVWLAGHDRQLAFRYLVDIADTKQALEVANTIQKDSFKAGALRNIATALAEAGDTTQAQAIFTQAHQVANTTQEDSFKAWALVDIATSLAKAGDTTQALQVANTIQEDSVKAWALRNIAIALAEAGDTTQALQVANTIQKDSVKAVALGNVNGSVESAGLLLFETNSKGQHVPIKKFSKEQLRLARMSIVASLTAERLRKGAH